MNNNIKTLINKGEKLLKESHPLKAFSIFEKVYKSTSRPIDLLDELILKSSYLGIWSAYSQKYYELMEYLAKISLNMQKKIKNPSEKDFLMLAKTLNGLSIALFYLGKKNISYSKKAIKILNKINISYKEEKVLKKRFKSQIKIYIGLIMNLAKNKEYKLAETEILKLTKNYQNLKLYKEYALCKKAQAYIFFQNKNLNQSLVCLLESEEVLRSLLKEKKTKEIQKLLSEIQLTICENHFMTKNFKLAYEKLKKIENTLENHQKINILRAKYYEKNKLFKKAKEEYLKAITLINKIKFSIITESKISSFLEENNYESIYLKGIYYSFIEIVENNIQTLISTPLDLLESYRSNIFISNILNPKSNKPPIFNNNLKERKNIESLIDRNLHSKNIKSKIKRKTISKLKKDLYDCDEKIYSHKNIDIFFRKAKLIPHNKIQSKIKTSEIIIIYFYHKNKLFITIISKEIYKTIDINIKESYLETLIKNYLNHIKTTSNLINSDLILEFYNKKLSEILLYKLDKHIKKAKKLILIPFKSLNHFPLHHIFFNKYPNILLSYLPNIQSLYHFKAKKLNQNKGLIIGNPNKDLAGSNQEAQLISKYFKSNLLITGDYVKSDIIAKYMQQYPVVHYSGHISYDKRNPLYSYIQCATNENQTNVSSCYSYDKSFLYLKDIMNLNLSNIEFISLSGCSSGLSKNYLGEELVGFVRGFFYSGVSSMIVSMWDIDDISSKDFFIEFFKSTFLNEGICKVGFNHTYNKMKSQYKHPFFYSSFILYEGL